jgi:hypothetical protein
MIDPLYAAPQPSHSREELLARSRRAKAILADPVFLDAVEDARRECVEDWTLAETVAAREQAWGRIRALDGVQRSLHRIVTAGEHVVISQT